MVVVLLSLATRFAYANGPTRSSPPDDLSLQEQITLNEARRAEMEQTVTTLEPYVVRNENREVLPMTKVHRL